MPNTLRRLLPIILFIAFLPGLRAQSLARDYALELTAAYNVPPNGMRISWKRDVSAQQYYIYRKAKQALSWTFLDSSLVALDSFYVDHTAARGVAYEYWVHQRKSTFSADGYIYAGKDLPVTDDRGIVLLLVDSNYRTPLATEIRRLENDLLADGWEVHQYHIGRSRPVSSVKTMIYNEWLSDSLRVKSVFLLGHIPVPYSGNIAPDGHPEHEGAWPADVYYVNFDLDWTDTTVNNNAAQRPENRNIPRDGKFDLDYIWPAQARIPIGRVDLSNMPAFGLSDTLLVKRYLDKDHLYRTHQLVAERRGIVDDNFGAFGGEAFAACGWRNFSTLFGDSVTAGDLHTDMSSRSYLFSYGCGGGSYTSASGVGTTSDYVSDSLLNPFTMQFGSYFGDWDNENNYLRAPLASKGWGLANAWAGRPYWMFHLMALGEPIGFATWCAQNAYPMYVHGYAGTYVHIALMGDPTLRLHTVAPVTGFVAAANCNTGEVSLRWDIPAGNDIMGYRIYRRSPSDTRFVFLAAASAQDSVFTDTVNTEGAHDYLIKAVKDEYSASGNYFNLSQGVSDTAFVYPKPVVQFTVSDTAGCLNGNSFSFTDHSSISAGNYTVLWKFGDGDTAIAGNPVHSFASAALFSAKLLVTSDRGCVDSATREITIHPSPVAGFRVNDSAQCLGSNIFVFTDTSALAVGTYSRTWSLGQGNVTAQHPAVKTYPGPGMYQVQLKIISNQGCADSARGQVAVFADPVAQFAVVDPAQCAGNIFTFVHPAGQLTHEWFFYNDTLPVVFNMDSIRVSYPLAGLFDVKLRVTDTNGCLDSTTQPVTVFPLPDASFITVQQSASSCEGAAVYGFEANQAGNDYFWEFGNGKTSVLVADSSKYDMAGNYRVKLLAKSPQGCDSKDSVTVSIYPVPALPAVTPLQATVAVAESKQFSVPSHPGSTYQWDLFPFGNIISGAQTNVITAEWPHEGWCNVRVNEVSSFGCVSDTGIALVMIIITGMEELDFASWFTVYPNPSSGKFTLARTTNNKDTWQLAITDITGKVIRELQLNGEETIIPVDITDKAAGNYLVKLWSKDKLLVTKLLISK